MTIKEIRAKMPKLLHQLHRSIHVLRRDSALLKGWFEEAFQFRLVIENALDRHIRFVGDLLRNLRPNNGEE